MLGSRQAAKKIKLKRRANAVVKTQQSSKKAIQKKMIANNVPTPRVPLRKPPRKK